MKSARLPAACLHARARCEGQQRCPLARGRPAGRRRQGAGRLAGRRGYQAVVATWQMVWFCVGRKERSRVPRHAAAARHVCECPPAEAKPSPLAPRDAQRQAGQQHKCCAIAALQEPREDTRPWRPAPALRQPAVTMHRREPAAITGLLLDSLKLDLHIIHNNAYCGQKARPERPITGSGGGDTDAQRVSWRQDRPGGIRMREGKVVNH